MVKMDSEGICSTSVHIQWDLRKDRDLGIKDLARNLAISYYGGSPAES